MSRKRMKTKSGVASFYIVAISTLVLVIIVVSFAAVIISEVNRTTNDDLAQSAYDSALVGVEDAKLAYYNYTECKNGKNSSGLGCGDIVKMVNEGQDCSMVAKILGRGEGEVKVNEGNENNMDQAYTCVKMSPVTSDYEVTISGGSKNIAKVKLKEDEDIKASEITSMVVHWSAKKDNGSLAVPGDSILQVGVVQTAESFDLDDFEMTSYSDGGQTNRGTVFLKAASDPGEDAGGDYETSKETLKKMLLKSNDKTVVYNELKNEPYLAYCPGVEGGKNPTACTVEMYLPEPIYGESIAEELKKRSDDTFYVSLANIGNDVLDVSLEFCNAAGGCTKLAKEDDEWKYDVKKTFVPLEMQVAVDSTGRANDLYRRVETRLGAGASGSGTMGSLGLDYAVQADKIEKVDAILCEQNFGTPNCSN